ncbi:MAG: hypothetical protein KGN76_10115 [Acidobacteriota bacterium]|nr:hypothetical protein [Acidobacteriota bacterium]
MDDLRSTQNLRIPHRAAARVVAVALSVACAGLVGFAAAPAEPPARDGTAAAAPLPDAEAFLEATRQNLASDGYLQREYSYKEQVTDIRMNPFGRMGTGDVLLYQVRPRPGTNRPWRRLIAKNGVPLTSQDLREQDRKLQQEEARREERLRRESPRDRERRLQEENEGPSHEQDMIKDVLSVFTFTLTGRDTIDGRPAILVTFAPKPGVEPHTREGRIAKHFRGQVWVLEAEHQVVRVHAEAMDDVSFVAGFVKIYKGFTATATRRQLADGNWLPEQTRFLGRGRAFFGLFFRTFDLDIVWRYFDYQRGGAPDGA